MLVIIPVSEADEQMVEPFSKLLEVFGGCENHNLLVVGSEDCEQLVNKLYSKVKHLFKNTSTHTFNCLAKGWPLGPNAYFRNTVSYLYTEMNVDEPWYWFELDNTPLKPGWLNSLQKEYDAAHAVFMGAKHPTFYADANNKLIIKGYHMAGTGIYPKNFTELSDLWRFEEGVAFDVWIQWEVLKAGLTDTPLIQHNWKSVNYRYDGDTIVCDGLPMPHPDLKLNHPLRDDAVVLHGCKDLSLTNLLLEKYGSKTNSSPTLESAVETPKQTTTKKSKYEDRRLKKFKNNWTIE